MYRAGCRDYIGWRGVAGPDFVGWSRPVSTSCGSDSFRASLLGFVDPVDVGFQELRDRGELLQPLNDERPAVCVVAADGQRHALLHPGPVVLELLNRAADAYGYVALVGEHRLVDIAHRLVERDEGVLAWRRKARGALGGHGGQGFVRAGQGGRQVNVEKWVRALVVGEQRRRGDLHRHRDVRARLQHRIDDETADREDRDDQEAGHVDRHAGSRRLGSRPGGYRCGRRGFAYLWLRRRGCLVEPRGLVGRGPGWSGSR